MYLYNFTLQQPQYINKVIYGSFSAPKQQEIIIAKNTVLELLVPDESGKLQVECTTDVFGHIRDLMPFRLPGSKQDFIVLATDSGKITILEYNKEGTKFVKLLQEAYGRSGCRREVPGQLLAADPKGRAIMVAAMEKKKYVYVMNRDENSRITISSPLEAHKSHTFVFSVVGLDVGFEHPIFAAIEVDSTEVDEDTSGTMAPLTSRVLTFYELDLGLNTVVRKWTDPVDNTANMLIPVPSGAEGPGGVLVCSENYITHKNQGLPERRVPLPRRRDLPTNRSTLITCSAWHRQKNLFFVVVGTEYGDLYRVTLVSEGDMVKDLAISYLDSIPPSTSMCVLRSGMLFSASESGSHYLYQFQGIGEDEGVSSLVALQKLGIEIAGDDHGVKNGDSLSLPFLNPRYVDGDHKSDALDQMLFDPRPLKNLVQLDELDNMSPVLGMEIADLAGDGSGANGPQIFTLCGAGPRSTIRVLRHGLPVNEVAASDMPGRPSAIWTCKLSQQDAHHHYIIISFSNATLVLAVGETVEEASATGFLNTVPTLDVCLLDDDAIVQVHASGIRHITQDLRVSEWAVPGNKQIVSSAVNNRQVLACLAGGEVYYFELDPTIHGLVERSRTDLQIPIACCGLGPVPEGEVRSPFIAIGGHDSMLRVYKISPDGGLVLVSMQSLAAVPSAILFRRVKVFLGDRTTTRLACFVGLQNGILIRTTVDPVTGDLSDARTRYLGAKPVKLFPSMTRGADSMIAVSSTTYLVYYHHRQQGYMYSPLSYDTLDYAAPFSTEQAAEGIAGISGNTLRIIVPERLGEFFHYTSIKTAYTPRKMTNTLKLRGANDQMTSSRRENRMLILECDHNTDPIFKPTVAEVVAPAPVAPVAPAPANDDMEVEMEMDIEEEPIKLEPVESELGIPVESDDVKLEDGTPKTLDPAAFGHSKLGVGHWASGIRVLDPKSLQSLDFVQLQAGEAATAMCLATFPEQSGDQTFVIVATAVNMTLKPMSCTESRMYCYTLDSTGKMKLVHMTVIGTGSQIVGAICTFGGRILAGVGHLLRIYDMGKRKMLRKCENRFLPNFVTHLVPLGRRRVAVGDVSQSVVFIKYHPKQNQLTMFADDYQPRWTTAICVVDEDTVAVGDKFGSIAVLRLPPNALDDIVPDPSAGGTKWLWSGAQAEAPNKLRLMAQFYVGSPITSITRASIVAGAADNLMYTTIGGGIGVMMALTSREEIDFFQRLEMHLREDNSPLSGNHHMHYRSRFYVVKDCVDGDFCEQYLLLKDDVQQRIAEGLQRTPFEIERKLSEIRARLV